MQLLTSHKWTLQVDTKNPVIISDMFMRKAVKSLRKRNAVWKGSSKVVVPEVLNVSAEKGKLKNVCEN